MSLLRVFIVYPTSFGKSTFLEFLFHYHNQHPYLEQKYGNWKIV